MTFEVTSIFSLQINHDKLLPHSTRWHFFDDKFSLELPLDSTQAFLMSTTYSTRWWRPLWYKLYAYTDCIFDENESKSWAFTMHEQQQHERRVRVESLFRRMWVLDYWRGLKSSLLLQQQFSFFFHGDYACKNMGALVLPSSLPSQRSSDKSQLSSSSYFLRGF